MFAFAYGAVRLLTGGCQEGCAIHLPWRADGKDIVQIGDDPHGLKTRWRFAGNTADSFHWIGEERASGNDPWRITYEHFARRTGP